MTREQLAETIALRIDSKSSELREQWRTAKPFGCFVLDELLPPAIAHEIHSNLPSFETLMLRSTIRERKRVGVDVQGHPLAHAALYAFQDDPVVRAVERVTGISQLQADPTLYASGVSAMAEGDFLNPHLDNSHDGNQSVYRVLNLLYYVTPGWQPRNGGNLELWDRRGRQPVEITATFNRLVVMATHQTSWHSVNQVKVPGVRWCLSNYYFSPQPPGEVPFRHVTTFRGRPEQPIRGHHQVALLPGLTLTAQLLFTLVFGPLGLLLALPLAVCLQVIIREILIRDVLDGWKRRPRLQGFQP